MESYTGSAGQGRQPSSRRIAGRLCCTAGREEVLDMRGCSVGRGSDAAAQKMSGWGVGGRCGEGRGEDREDGR